MSPSLAAYQSQAGNSVAIRAATSSLSTRPGVVHTSHGGHGDAIELRFGLPVAMAESEPPRRNLNFILNSGSTTPLATANVTASHGSISDLNAGNNLNNSMESYNDGTITGIVNDSEESSLVHIDLRKGIHKGPSRTPTGRLKRNSREDDDSDRDADPPSYKDAGRFPFKQQAFHIHRAFDLFGDIHTLINNGIRRQALMEAEEAYDNIQSNRDFESYNLIMEHIPQLREEVIRLHNDPKEFCRLTRKLKESADIARNNDNANLKKDVPLYLTGDGNPAIKTRRENQRASSKSDRGFYNDTIGRFLCPINLDWDDENIRQNIRDGKISITAEEFPRLLYSDCKYNADDIEEGLCRNMAHLRTVKYIFTGRSSAFSDTPGGKTTRAGNAKIAGVKKITPRMIAYGACLLRFALSSEETWNIMDCEFHMEDFYWSVVHLFDDSGAFGDETLAWWNKEVLGISRTAGSTVPKPAPNSSLERLADYRAKKRARLALVDKDLNVTVHPSNEGCS